MSAHGHRATDLSESSCKFHFNAATTPFAELCTFSPLYFPPSALHFPSRCHGGVFGPALYHLCQQTVRVAIRPSWQTQTMTGGSLTGSLHMSELGSVLFKPQGREFLLLASFVFQFPVIQRKKMPLKEPESKKDKKPPPPSFPVRIKI